VRDLPFRDASFDAIYSIGTIEHFDETERAVEEMARVLKPGGRAIIGVPNRYDPGWVRMLDLACHAWCRPFAAVTGALVRPFVFLDRHVPAVRRHGYLLATVGMKPELGG
jgi:ubiquinone/menaquinone biosynthesis C-methylase UbiE